MNMPGFYQCFSIYKELYVLKITAPYIFYEDTDISAIFDVFPGTIWNGGTLLKGISNSQEIKSIISFYNEVMNVPIRYTFTNPVLKPEHCYDTYSNLLAEAGHNGKNEILVSSPCLEEYLRKNYPNYKYCRSIIGAENTYYDEEQKYHLSVMKRSQNNKWEYLDTIPMEHRKNIEFLCTDLCPDDCPYIYSHYEEYGNATLEYVTSPNEKYHIKCLQNDKKTDFPFHNIVTNSNTYISREMIVNNYVPKGFEQFKCSGRTDPSFVIENVVSYLIKPEYHRDVRSILYHEYFCF